MIHNTLIANKDEYKPTFVWSPVSTLPLSLLGLFAFGFSGVDGIVVFLLCVLRVYGFFIMFLMIL